MGENGRKAIEKEFNWEKESIKLLDLYKSILEHQIMNFLVALQVTNKEKKLFKGIKIVKVCIGEWKNQSRDEREMTLLQELGAEVVIVAKTSDIEKSEIINGLKIEKISTKPIKFKPLTFFNKG